MGGTMEELEILRKLATCPHDMTVLGAYADWLAEHGREADEAEVRRAMVKLPRPTNQAKYYLRIEGDAGTVEWGCQTVEEFVALSGQRRGETAEEIRRKFAMFRDALKKTGG